MDAAFRSLCAGVRFNSNPVASAVVAPAAVKRARAPSARDARQAAAASATSFDDESSDGGLESSGDQDDVKDDGIDADVQLFAGRRVSSIRHPVNVAEMQARRADASARADMRALRKHVHLRVYGSHVPDSISTFSDINGELLTEVKTGLAATQGLSAAAVSARHVEVRARMLKIIEESAYVEPTAVQMQSLPTLLAGRDLLAAAPTGSGKTAAYAIPLVLSLQRHCKRAGGIAGPRAIVIVPTRELAAQTVREIDRLGGRALGICTMALTRETASGTLGERVSAAADAASLMRVKSSKKRKDGQVNGVKQDDANDDVLHWTDEEEDEVALVNRNEHGAAEPTAAGANLVLPSLPKCDVLVVTPLIFVAVLRHAKRQAPQSEPLLASVRHVVLDEVDNLLDLGFIEQVDEILSALPTTELLERLAAQLPPAEAAAVAAAAPLCHVQRAMLTATLPSGVEELAMSVLRDPVRASVGVRGATVSTVEQRLVFVGKERGKAVALKQMLTDGISPPVLVFAQSKDRVEQVSRLLQLEGASSVGFIHADRSPAQRDEAVTDFRRGKSMFLVTTDVLGRGIDFKGVNVVINFDFPTSAVSYVHRIGRTGRAGRTGLAVTFFTEDDIPLLRSIANVMRLSGCDVPAWQLTLKKISRKEKGRVMKRKNVAVTAKKGGVKKK